MHRIMAVIPFHIGIYIPPNKNKSVLHLGQSKKGDKDQETIQLSTTPDREYHMESNKNTINVNNKSQEVSILPTGEHKAAMDRRESMRNTRQKNINDPKKKYRLGAVINSILLEGLNQFHGANLTLKISK